MRKTLTLLMVGAVALTACAPVRDSRLNPLNWFGRSQEVNTTQAAPGEANPLIPTRSGLFTRDQEDPSDFTTPIATITDLRIERIPGGAIVRATGRDSTKGAFNVILVPSNPDELPVDGVLSYTLERQRPSGSKATGTEQSREVVVARRLTDQQLQGVRTIRVSAAQNARETRRR